MPRVHHVKKARKARRDYRIKKGDSYYWWKFRHGGKRISKTYPRRSQLTQSEFYAMMFDAEDTLLDLTGRLRSGEVSPADAESTIEEVRSDLDTQADECRSKYDNMPDSLQQGPTGELLEQRADFCEQLSGELENLDFSEDKDREELADEIESLDWSCD